MDYPQAIQFLQSLTQFGLQPGLETTRLLAARAGNPHERLRFIHVAGTNGKGSTCAFLESIYRAAGLRVGLYTSPHLVSFRERIQVNRQTIGEADVARIVAELRSYGVGQPASGPVLQPTFFEFVTVLALKFFAEQNCDLVIWETGLGGRLDATNIVTPLASVITNISFDHMQWLGDTLAKIAAEKAGIIKPHVPVIKADDPPEVMAVIEDAAHFNRSPLRLVYQADTHRAPLDRLELPLPGAHQRINAAVAVATVRELSGTIPVTNEQLLNGLASAKWPGRFQRIRLERGRELVLDGAHNAAGADTLRMTLAEIFPGCAPALLLGILADKDWREVVKTLAPAAGRIYVTPVGSSRTLAAAELAAACRAANPRLEVLPCTSLAEAMARASDEPLLVITGSLYLVGEALERLGETLGAGERGLNEWQGDRAGR